MTPEEILEDEISLNHSKHIDQMPHLREWIVDAMKAYHAHQSTPALLVEQEELKKQMLAQEYSDYEKREYEPKKYTEWLIDKYINQSTPPSLSETEYVYDTVNKKEARGWFKDSEGNFYMDIDPHGLQMDSSRKIKPIGKKHHQYEVRDHSKTVLIDNRQELFNLLVHEHDLILAETELDEIIRVTNQQITPKTAGSEEVRISELAKKEKGRNFDRGYACAVANLISLHGMGTEAEETFKQNFASFKSLQDIGLSEFDAEILKKHF